MYSIQFLQFLSLCVLILSKNYANPSSESTVPSSSKLFPAITNGHIATTVNLTPTNYTLRQIIRQINDSKNEKETLHGQEQVQNPSIEKTYSNGFPSIELFADYFRDSGLNSRKIKKTEAFGDNSNQYKDFSTARSLTQHEDEEEEGSVSRDIDPGQGGAKFDTVYLKNLRRDNSVQSISPFDSSNQKSSKRKFEIEKRKHEDSLPIQREYDYDHDANDNKDEEEDDDDEVEDERPSNQPASLNKPSLGPSKFKVDANINRNQNLGEQSKERNGRNYYPVSRQKSMFSSQPESPIFTDKLSINKFPSKHSSKQNEIPKSSIYSSSVIHYVYTGNESSNQEAFEQNNENKLVNGSMKGDVHLNDQSNNKTDSLSAKLPNNHRSSETLASSGAQSVSKLLGNKRKSKDPFLRG